MREQLKRILFDTAIGTMLIAALSILVYDGFKIKKERDEKIWAEKPSRIELIADLNQDEIKDAIMIKNNGYKIPFFGTTNNTYLSSDEMEKLYPKNITSWAKIEARLNNN